MLYGTLIHRSAWNRNSRKFTVSSHPAPPRPATLRMVPEKRIGRIGAPLATIESRQCYRPLRLATVQLPQGFLFLRPSTLMHERRGQTGSRDWLITVSDYSNN